MKIDLNEKDRQTLLHICKKNKFTILVELHYNALEALTTELEETDSIIKKLSEEKCENSLT